MHLVKGLRNHPRIRQQMLVSRLGFPSENPSRDTSHWRHRKIREASSERTQIRMWHKNGGPPRNYLITRAIAWYLWISSEPPGQTYRYPSPTYAEWLSPDLGIFGDTSEIHSDWLASEAIIADGGGRDFAGFGAFICLIRGWFLRPSTRCKSESFSNCRTKYDPDFSILRFSLTRKHVGFNCCDT